MLQAFRTSATVTILSLFALTMTVGCDDGRPQRYSVSGKVLIDGEPLTSGYVRVSPANAKAATGEIQSDGSFELTTFTQGDGVVPGTHPMIVYAGEYISDLETMWHAPPKYSKSDSSDLTLAVDGETDEAVIELTWDGGKPFKQSVNVKTGL